MKRALMAISVFLICFQAFAVTGRSVTAFLRYGAGVPERGLPMPADPWGTTMNEAGALGRFTINGASITVDTIIKRTTAFCQFPILSLDGSRVAFFRWPYRLVNNALQKIANDTASISIVDINGRTMKDLARLPATPGFTSNLAWAGDGWIYYIRPRTSTADGFVRSGNEVWKVNPYSATPASTNAKVMEVPACAYVHRFSVDKPADKYCLMTYPIPAEEGNNCAGDQWNGASRTWNPIKAELGTVGGCNDKISPSGSFIGGFCNTNHTFVCMAGWNGSRYSDFPGGYGETHSEALIASQWAGFSMNNDAVGSEYFQWSSNSDKWYCHGLYWHYCCNFRGQNQLIINWVNKQAVMTSRNPDVPGDPNGDGAATNTAREPAPGVIAYHATTGDFWVKPPSAQYDYAYEDTLGAWHQMTKPAGWTLGDTAGPTPVAERGGMAAAAHGMTARLAAGGELRIDFPDARTYAVSIVDMRGRTALAQSAHANVMLNAQALNAGVYLVRASRPGMALTSAFSVAK